VEGGSPARARIPAVNMPVRKKDFSQSADDGPRMLPSIKARPGQRVQVPRCAHEEQVGKSFPRMERASRSCDEFLQMLRKASLRTLPQGNGNCTRRDVAGGVAGAAGIAFTGVIVHRGRGNAEGADVANEIGVSKDGAQVIGREAEETKRHYQLGMARASSEPTKRPIKTKTYYVFTAVESKRRKELHKRL